MITQSPDKKTHIVKRGRCLCGKNAGKNWRQAYGGEVTCANCLSAVHWRKNETDPEAPTGEIPVEGESA